MGVVDLVTQCTSPFRIIGEPINQARGHGPQLKLVPVKEEAIHTNDVPTMSQSCRTKRSLKMDKIPSLLKPSLANTLCMIRK